MIFNKLSIKLKMKRDYKKYQKKGQKQGREGQEFCEQQESLYPKKMNNDYARKACYIKRKRGLLKKAVELSCLCD